MSNENSNEERRSSAPGEDRRNYTPPGRLRRILFDHRASVWAAIGVVVLLMILFAGTTAYAVNERFKREVAEIAYNRDLRSLQFLLAQEAEGLNEISDTVAALDTRVQELTEESQPYLVVSLEERRLWYLSGQDTLFTVPVAVGSGRTLVMGGRTHRFQTPRGRMTITHKELEPTWVPPDWHYHRIAQSRGLRVVNMRSAPRNALTEMGFPEGREPIGDGVVYLPPWGSPQSKHKGVLGAAKLEMRDGYYFHGTNDESSIGTAASAGCIRLRRDDILWMYENVPVGTPVYIY